MTLEISDIRCCQAMPSQQQQQQQQRLLNTCKLQIHRMSYLLNRDHVIL